MTHECRQLSIRRVAGMLCRGYPIEATLDCDGLALKVVSESRSGFFVEYRLTFNVEQMKDRFGVTSTIPNYGGLRFWWLCQCGARVAVLYLPPGQQYFRCRACHRLTYRSSRRSHRRVSFYRRNRELAHLLLVERTQLPARELAHIFRALGVLEHG
jgi:hypothetical protein